MGFQNQVTQCYTSYHPLHDPSQMHLTLFSLQI